jgi:hypothetical protein
MAQEFFIKSSNLESKIRQLLPSQGGLGAGFDLSASTQIVPIVDLTESAEGSNVRQDLQTALSFTNANAFFVSNTSTTIINNTGYFRIIAGLNMQGNSSTNVQANIDLTDGVTIKQLWGTNLVASAGNLNSFFNIDLVVFLAAGQSCSLSASANCSFFGSSRQIADIDGNLTDTF